MHTYATGGGLLSDPPTRRRQPLVQVACPDRAEAEHLARCLRTAGAYILASSEESCLRVAAATGPDVVVLDVRLPPRLERLLRVHPATAGSHFLHLSPGWSRRGDVLRYPAVEHALAKELQVETIWVEGTATDTDGALKGDLRERVFGCDDSIFSAAQASAA